MTPVAGRGAKVVVAATVPLFDFILTGRREESMHGIAMK
jgi:hypothetical protein